MKKHKYIVTETLIREHLIEADDDEDAFEEFSKRYNSGTLMPFNEASYVNSIERKIDN
jgi:hypothetical protein